MYAGSQVRPERRCSRGSARSSMTSAVSIPRLAPGQQLPPADASSVMTPLYHAMERAIARVYPHDLVVPYMTRGATDGSVLRSRGMPVYGVPVFLRDTLDSGAHGNDERISPKSLDDGVEILWQMVLGIGRRQLNRQCPGIVETLPPPTSHWRSVTRRLSDTPLSDWPLVLLKR